MRRPLNLRQIEAFKAVVENGTVSRAAEMLNISQPAVSKLIAHLEEDTGLELFDRLKGRLAPTVRGMRLYEEVDRIFAGVRQVETAVAAIRREEQGRLLVGVMPALSGAFIQQATTGFLRTHPNVYCSIQSRSSQWIADWLVTRKLDVGLISSRIDNPYIATESLMQQPLVCIMPLDHPLTARSLIEPNDLDGVPFISFDPESYTGRQIATVFESYRVRVNFVLDATTSPTLCEFVAAGLGVSLVHPLFISGLQGRVAVRRFEPLVPFDFQLCRAYDIRNASLVEAFVQETRSTAERISRELLSEA
ncbi:LysR substrate-binding domain-containing protein [Microvirga brassicacearum]|uniref:LysR family transcriptional regulator n=1 Tax=Microvirga brassicacearum TaxID=2580413 RepID=A0A5N3PHK3_9HYPH|nr:LysR substrate-binding domain-containing protein [Microvirga brassicacearum]KAB0269219.1 LysR family transcriptional regulator [Microvirga brassicacearum]